MVNLTKHCRFCFLLLAGLVAFCGRSAAQPPAVKNVDPTGKWVWEQSFGNTTIQHELVLQIDDGALTGTHQAVFSGGGRFGRAGNNQPSEIVDAAVDGDEIHFGVARRFGNNSSMTIYAGVISGDEIAGVTRASFGGQDRESAWMAKRVVATADESSPRETGPTEQPESDAQASREVVSQATGDTVDVVPFHGPSADQIASAQPGRVPAPGPDTGEPYQPQPILAGGIVVPIYTSDSPALNAERIHEPEQYNMTNVVPGRIQSIVNIHNPSIEVHRADSSINTGTAVILAAGGGHRTLNVGTEAGDFVPFFFNYGVNCVILRNRLRNDGYSAEVDAVNDALQAIRVVRAYAPQWGIDPNRIGIMGFSAGAELSGPAAFRFEQFDRLHHAVEGPLSGVSSRPDFVGLLYPGPSPLTNDPAIPIPRNAPPSFVATSGSGDRIHAIWAMDYFNAMLRTGIPNIELHVYGNGIHAGGLKDRQGTPFGTWQDRFVDWFRDLGFLTPPDQPTKAAVDSAEFAAQPTRQRSSGRGTRRP